MNKLSEYLGLDFPGKLVREALLWVDYLQLKTSQFPTDVVHNLPPHHQFPARLAIESVLRWPAGVAMAIADVVAQGSDGIAKEVLPDGGSFYILRGPHAQALFEQLASGNAPDVRSNSWIRLERMVQLPTGDFEGIYDLAQTKGAVLLIEEAMQLWNVFLHQARLLGAPGKASLA